MKSKELIRQLQEADPTGEEEVSVGNVDIYFVERQPAYWDGRQQVLIRDETRDDYNIIGAKLRTNGIKIKLHCVSIADAIWDNPDLPIDYSDLSDDQKARYKESHDKVREAARELESESELEYFNAHILNRVRQITDDEECVPEICRDFFNKFLSPKDPIPEHIPIIGESYVSRRNKQWLEQIDVYYDENGVHLRLK